MFSPVPESSLKFVYYLISYLYVIQNISTVLIKIMKHVHLLNLSMNSSPSSRRVVYVEPNFIICVSVLLCFVHTVFSIEINKWNVINIRYAFLNSWIDVDECLYVALSLLSLNQTSLIADICFWFHSHYARNLNKKLKVAIRKDIRQYSILKFVWEQIICLRQGV